VILTLIVSTVSTTAIVIAGSVWGGFLLALCVVIEAFLMAVFGSAMTLTYLRLREIKEGYGVPDVAEVFE